MNYLNVVRHVVNQNYSIRSVRWITLLFPVEINYQIINSGSLSRGNRKAVVGSTDPLQGVCEPNTRGSKEDPDISQIDNEL